MCCGLRLSLRELCAVPLCKALRSCGMCIWPWHNCTTDGVLLLFAVICALKQPQLMLAALCAMLRIFKAQSSRCQCSIQLSNLPSAWADSSGTAADTESLSYTDVTIVLQSNCAILHAVLQISSYDVLPRELSNTGREVPSSICAAALGIFSGEGLGFSEEQDNTASLQVHACARVSGIAVFPHLKRCRKTQITNHRAKLTFRTSIPSPGSL